ncbi:autophagy-related protein 29 [Monosporozyma unispora]|nr:Autophagy protein 29 [Kazachstania unispora]
MDNRNTIIYVKVKGKRPPDFKDPKLFEWNEDKDKQLWKFISKLDNSIEQINWTNLSTILNAPKEFLKQRSYKLFNMHMSLMKKQLDIKKLPPNQVEVSLQQNLTLQNQSNDDVITLKEKTSSPQRKILTAMNSFKESPINSVARSEKRLTDIEKDIEDNGVERDTDQESLPTASITEALNQLHTSRVLGRAPDMITRGTRNTRERLNEDYDSDLSSSLSVSKSALEEALLDRLHF